MSTLRSLPFSLLLALGGAAPCSAQTQATWVNVSPLTGGPGPRDAATMAWDAARGRIVLFGGSYGDPPIFPADTWEWDGLFWIRRVPAGASPVGRANASLAYDAARGQVLLFGGWNGGTALGDTWTWDGTSWTRRLPAASPSPRFSAGVAYDAARQRVVVFGGWPLAQADTWEWDGTNWNQRAPVTSPPGRADGVMAYDASRGHVVLFGGVASSGTANDTWGWNGVNWTELQANGVPALAPRRQTFLVPDPTRQRLVLFGGRGRSGELLQDTWEWDGIQWTQVFTSASPSARAGAAMAFDAGRGRVVLFGGTLAAAGALADTWALCVDCRRVGPGHTAGSPPITCATLPLLGGSLCLSFQSPQRAGWLILGPACDGPFVTLDPPLVCSRGNLYPEPTLWFYSGSNPALSCLPLPFEPALVGAHLCFQGLVLDQSSCLLLTDGVEARLRM